MNTVKYDICVEIEKIGRFSSIDRNGKRVLQRNLSVRHSDINKYVAAAICVINGNEVPYYHTPDTETEYWCNGKDNQEYLHESLSVFDTPQEAHISINKVVPNNTIHYVLEKITLIDNAIILKRVD